MSSEDDKVKVVNVTASNGRVVMTIRMCLGKISDETGQCLECGAWPSSLDGSHAQEDEDEE